MKKLLLILLWSVTASVMALPTIAMPDLIMATNEVIPVQQPGKLIMTNPGLNLPVTIKTNLPQFSADIRGALINSGQFKVMDTGNIKFNNLTSINQVLGRLNVESQINPKQVKAEINFDDAATQLADGLFASDKLKQCDSYTLQAPTTSNQVSQEFNQAFLNKLTQAPDFTKKYVYNDMTNANLMASNVTNGNKVAQCQIQVTLTSENSLYDGIKHVTYQINASLTNPKEQLLLWQQQIKINTMPDYYLIGIINEINQNEDNFPIKGTTNLTKQYFVEVAADFKLVRTNDKAIIASFSAVGQAHDVKIVAKGELANSSWHHDLGSLIAQASKSLAQNVLSQMMNQFTNTLNLNQTAKEKPANVTDVKVYK